MSGPLSVPFAIAAIFVESQTAKILLGLTALACFWASAYYVWKPERGRVVELEATADRDAVAREAKDKLWELRTEGYALVRDGRKRVVDPAGASAWQAQYDDWLARVLDAAGAYSRDLRRSFDPLNEIAQVSRVSVKFNEGKHPGRVHTAQEICARLYKVLSPA